MDHFREIKNKLAWHKEGKFEVELVNGVIRKLNFCEPGTGPDGVGKCLTSTDYKFLQNVYACLGDLFTFIDEENKRLGYSYSREDVLPHTYQLQQVDDDPHTSNDTIVRPLINYNDQPASGDADQNRNMELTA